MRRLAEAGCTGEVQGMRLVPLFHILFLLAVCASALHGQDPGQVRRFFREHGVSLLTPSDGNRDWRQKNGAELPPGNLWAGQSADQTHSLTLRVVESRGEAAEFAQAYAKILQAEAERLGLKLSQAAPASLGSWPAWRMEFAGKLGREEASQITWLIAANNRVYDLSCLAGGSQVAQDTLVLGFAKGFEFIQPPNPAPRAETWTEAGASWVRWAAALGGLLLCGCLGMLRNRIISGWSLGLGATLLGLAGVWWWTLISAGVGAALLWSRQSPAGERRLEVVSLLFAAGAFAWLIARGFL